MKTNHFKEGFIIPLVIALIVAFSIGAGVYSYSHKNKTEVKSSVDVAVGTTTDSTATTSPSNPQKDNALSVTGQVTVKTPTPPKAVPSIVQEITQAYNNKTLYYKIGDRFVVSLGSTLSWTVTSSNPQVASRVENALVIGESQGIYSANAVGTTKLSATGKPICKENEACPTLLAVFSVTLVVTK